VLKNVNVNEQRLSKGLGWFSIGLGVAEVVAPGRLARLIGIKERPSLIRGLGMREIASGVGILTQRRPAGFLWSRVAGDAMDLSLLGAAINSDDNESRKRTIAATATLAGVTVLDVLCSQRLTLSPETGYRGIRVHKTITVNRPIDQAYGFWRNFQNLPRFMKHLESVQVMGDKRSHWRAKAPAGRTVEWDAELVEDNPNSRIAWRSIEGADVDNSGSVQFETAPGNRGSIVRVEIQYNPPGGALGAAVAKLFGEEPGQQLDDDLRAFKQIMETGEVVKSDASIHRGTHAARPPAKREEMITR
jgi:uncharacterized membrane protein